MNTPKVSVIVPTYNRASLLGTAIESVLAQTFRDLEVVVVDDGSSDATEALVRHYEAADARVRYLAQQHRGISAAMNTGIRASRGQYIARVDSDDQWLPQLLETAVGTERPDPADRRHRPRPPFSRRYPAQYVVGRPHLQHHRRGASRVLRPRRPVR